MCPDVSPSVTDFCRLNWCDSGWWGYQLNTNQWCQWGNPRLCGNPSSAIWWPKLKLMHMAPLGGQTWSWEKVGKKLRKSWKKLETAQRTQGVDSISWVISKVDMKISWRDYSRYGVNALGPLCLWQCFKSFFPKLMAISELLWTWRHFRQERTSSHDNHEWHWTAFAILAMF